MWWHEQSWPRIEQLDKQIPVVLPLGSCEQHGHHLPLFVDSIQVEEIATNVEKALGDRVLVLPTQWLGSSHHHKDFPGTITLSPSLYTSLVQEMARSILRAGFRRLFFLNGHGGNQVPGAQALTELVAEDDLADDAYLSFGSWWHVGRDSITPQGLGLESPHVTHACEYETSFMLAVRPDLVHLDKAREGDPVLKSDWFTFEDGGRVSVYRRFHRMTASGSMGKPSAASGEKGSAILDAVVRDVVAFLEDFASWPALRPLKAPGNNS